MNLGRTESVAQHSDSCVGADGAAESALPLTFHRSRRTANLYSRRLRQANVVPMANHIVTLRSCCGLASLLLGAANPVTGQVDQQRAEAYFKEAAEICQRDGGRLWGVSLCGPIVIADARTGTIATSQQPPAADRPRTFGLANAPVEWGGSRWVSLVWDFTTSLPDASTRGELMLHELFHRIQPQLGLMTPGNAIQNAHLDTFEGRLWLRLEWRALVRALADSGEARTRAVRDALAFRATRRSLFLDAAEKERREEIREGIAQYTGIVTTAATRSEAVGRTIKHVTGAEGHETFLQQSYTTGTALAVLLDDASPDWRRRVRSESDLGQMLMTALNVTPTADAAEASARYGGADIRVAEQARAERQRAVVRELRSRFVDGPLLLVPSGGGATFNAVGATPIPGIGTVYVQPYNAKGQWGTLDARTGVLIGDDGTRRVAGPVRINGDTLSGDGWTATIAPGWAVRSGPRSGDYQILRDPH